MHGITMGVPLLIILTLIGTEMSEADKMEFPFCKLCLCASNKDVPEENMDVTCTTNIQYNIFNDAFWYTTINHTSQSEQTKGNKTVFVNHTTQNFQSYAYNSINFQNNEFINLTYTFPPSNLTYLNLANNAIYKINQSVFMNLQNMRTLILSHNDLEILDPSAFSGKYLEGALMPLKSLKELRLDHNNLHTLNKDLFEHTIDIEILDLSSNPLQVIDHHTLVAIDGLVSLKELYLQYTGISTLPDNMLHTPKYLEILDLSGNPIKELPKTLEQAHSLTNLYLNNTEFVNLTEQNGFPELPNLKVLHMCRNEHLSRLLKNSLSGLSGLEEFRLSDNIDLIELSPQSLAKHMNGIGGAIWPPIKKVAGIARSQELMEDLAKQLENEKGQFYPVVTDLTREASILEAFEFVKVNLGPVHILVNSAGVVKVGLLIEGKTEDWTNIFQVNVIGLGIATREAIKDMRENNVDGHIVHINSVVGHYVKDIRHSVYPASKHAVTAMAEIQRKELASLKSKIKTTSLSPGLVNTRILSPTFRNSELFQKEFIEPKIILQPEDVAEGVIFALSTPPHVEIAEMIIRPVGETFGDRL